MMAHHFLRRWHPLSLSRDSISRRGGNCRARAPPTWRACRMILYGDTVGERHADLACTSCMPMMKSGLGIAIYHGIPYPLLSLFRSHKPGSLSLSLLLHRIYLTLILHSASIPPALLSSLWRVLPGTGSRNPFLCSWSFQATPVDQIPPWRTCRCDAVALEGFFGGIFATRGSCISTNGSILCFHSCGIINSDGFLVERESLDLSLLIPF